jgi:glycosyltransferase involved in cell wall biosynthesis
VVMTAAMVANRSVRCSPLRKPAVKRVALNAVFLQRRMGGIETAVRELVPALLRLEPQLSVVMLVTPAGRQALADERWADEVDIVSSPILTLPMTKAVSELTLIGMLADRQRADVIHSVAMIGPVHSRAASVVSIPDVTWWRDPSTVPRPTRLLWRTFVPIGARHARRIITYSRTAAEEISEDLSISLSRIDVVPLGPGTTASTAPRSGAELRVEWDLGPGPILLAISGLSPHKNVDTLVKAMPQIRERRPDAVLVVPGNPTDYGAKLTARARALGVDSSIRFPGWIDAARLEGLYRESSCLVFPSRREGFGLPILEAMGRGLPVVCARASAIPEVAGDAALYFDPESSEELASAVGQILSDDGLALRLAAAGRRRAAEFSWRRAAKETLEVYERAAQQR